MTSGRLSAIAALLLAAPRNGSSFQLGSHETRRKYRSGWTSDRSGGTAVLQASAGGRDESLEKLRELEESRIRQSLIESLFATDDDGPPDLVDLRLVGQAVLPLPPVDGKSAQRPVLVLADAAGAVGRGPDDSNRDAEPVPSLLLPLTDRAQLQLVSFAVANRPLSKSVMLQLNLQLVNRDGALFDNLPWSTWTVDPHMRNRDAAGNNILDKFHLGKRDAYQRFMGKDWQGRSLAIGNLALRLKYMLERDENNSTERNVGADSRTLVDSRNRQEQDVQQDTPMDQSVLAKRILELEVRELKMDLAGVDSDIALATAQSDATATLDNLQRQRSQLVDKLEQTQRDLSVLNQPSDTTQNGASVASTILNNIASWSTNDDKNTAPYRGATGYAPMLDSKQDIQDGILPYTNPYDLLAEILQDQLNARVIGCVLENTSLLKGNLALGGVVVLQRIVATQTIEVMGEKLDVSNPDEEFGNQGVKGGEVILVECDADEAVSISAALDVPLRIDSDILRASSIMCTSKKQQSSSTKSSNILSTLPVYAPVDSEVSLQIEGVRNEVGKPSPVAIPRTTAGITDMFSGDSSDDRSSGAMFPQDNPVQSVQQFDDMSTEDKTKTLLEMSNFRGRLPRPRVVKTTTPNPLDTLMLPLIDESVRREIRIRQAKEQGDDALAEQLEQEKSKYQRAREAAAIAREMNIDQDADAWENEAEFLSSLRADVTQDEGSYNRFLDKDDWYERNRQATAKRTKRSSFGTLLDGIE